jgi:serine/threonine-protein kinase
MLAFDITDDRGQDDIWIYDWKRDTITRRTFESTNERGAIWTPDGRRITFSSGRPGDFGLYWRRADGTGDTQRLTQSKDSQSAGSWHPSGRLLAFTETRGPTRSDLMLLQVDGDEASGWKPCTPTGLLQTSETEALPAFSPDGRGLAYMSTQSGRQEIWVRSFPGSGGTWQVTTEGGTEPVWSRTRKELFYRNGARVMVATYATDGDSFRVEQSRQVGLIRNRPRQPLYGLHPDGERLVVAAVATSDAPQNTIVFVLNFFDELRRAVR